MPQPSPTRLMPGAPLSPQTEAQFRQEQIDDLRDRFIATTQWWGACRPRCRRARQCTDAGHACVDFLVQPPLDRDGDERRIAGLETVLAARRPD